MGPAPTSALRKPPRPTPGPPLIGNLNRIRLNNIAQTTHELLRENHFRTMKIGFLAKEAYYFRHPDDVADILGRRAASFQKPSFLSKLDLWLGDGLFSQQDAGAHARMRETLNPAFRLDYLSGLVPAMAGSAQQLAQLMQAQAASSGANATALMELQGLMKRFTLDVLGLTNLCYDFQAVSSNLGGRGGSGGASRGAAPSLDVVQTLLDIEAVAVPLTLELPLPDWLLPGYQGYLDGVTKLRTLVTDIIEQRRTKGLGAEERDLMAFLLRSGASDKQIQDELMTMLFAGSDTSANTLALALHELAQQPELQERAAEEARLVLAGRSASGLTAADARALPFITAVINETLRLWPAGPILVRRATQDEAIGAYDVRAGTLTVSNLYAMHRHEELWAAPDEFQPARWLPEGEARFGALPTNAFMPFSTGARSCIGRVYAMQQMQLTMIALMAALRFELPAPADRAAHPAVRISTGITLKSDTGVWLSVSARR